MKKFALLIPVLVFAFASSVDAQCCGNKAKAETCQEAAKACSEKAQDCSKGQCSGEVAKATSGTISTGALLALMHAKTPMTLIDARKDTANGIPGAKSVCSKSMACTTYQAKTLGNKDRLLVTYCSGPKCSASSKMATKLRAAGYTNVIEYREGVAGWTALKSKFAKLSGSCCNGAKSDCSGGSCTGDAAAKAAGCTAGNAAKAGACCPSTGKTAAPAAPIARIDANGLKALQSAKVPMVLIDARSGKYDDGNRIPGAIAIKNCTGSCWTKPETYKNIVKSKNALVVTYCGASKCPLSSMVAGKLRAAGYTNVIEYKGGLADWKKLGNKTVNAEAGCCGGSSCPSKTGAKTDNCSTGSCGTAKTAKKEGCCGSSCGGK